LTDRYAASPIGRALLAGDIPDGSTITVDAEGDEIVVTWRVPEVQPEAEATEEVGAPA
jgi:ATP-dependent Clp protease ATP-binding subunit ClpB